MGNGGLTRMTCVNTQGLLLLLVFFFLSNRRGVLGEGVLGGWGRYSKC